MLAILVALQVATGCDASTEWSMRQDWQIDTESNSVFEIWEDVADVERARLFLICNDTEQNHDNYSAHNIWVIVDGERLDQPLNRNRCVEVTAAEKLGLERYESDNRIFVPLSGHYCRRRHLPE